MSLLEKIRKQKPLIHHITNWVTIYDCAQITRSIGALPVMAHAKEEMEEMVSISSALVLNIGTLTPELIEAQILAGKKANEKGIPVVLDIVGCGATTFRTEMSKKLVQDINISILKGNQGEISVFAGAGGEVRGVESLGGSDDIKNVARSLAKKHDCVVIVTGKEDIIASAEKVDICNRGHRIMGEVVGTGCMSASVLGCFASVSENIFDASLEAMRFYGYHGERAADEVNAPMEFKKRLLDEIAK